MMVSIIAVICGILLLADRLPSGFASLTGALKPFGHVIGVVALVLGVIHFGLMGIALIIAGFVLAMGALKTIPKVGDNLYRAGIVMEKYQHIIGIVILVFGVFGFFHAI